jgi:penicillin-binding protein 1A
MDKLSEVGARLESFFQGATFLALLVLSIIAGGLTGLVLAYQASFTSYAAEVEALADYRPSEITKVYADDGKTVIGELALERRIPLSYEEIPDLMKKAILAIEDARFDEHVGIDPIRLIGAAIENFRRNRRAQGGSTLTQQLARLLFLKPEKTYSRKLREIMYALQIERYYTKEQILTLYCNQIFLGGGAYGVEAAARYYFSKSVKELKLEEYALLAALPKAPQQYSPVLHPEAARARRNLVLQAMADEGFITQAEADQAKARPIKLNIDDARNKNDRSPYAYFVEEVRQELQRILAERPAGNAMDAMDLYRAGLSVYTTLDPRAQEEATKAVRKMLRAYDQRHGWRGKFYNVIEKEGADVETYRHPSWTFSVTKPGEILTGLIKEVREASALVSFGKYFALVTAKETTDARRGPAQLFKRGDLAQFVVEAVDEAKKSLTVRLELVPEVQGALVLLDAKTGEIKAMVGGYDFAITKFNHATQANRQTGSAFKPFIYAAAIEQGLRPDDLVVDAPFRRGNWEPHNYDDSYMGVMTLRKALALSRNIPAVRVLDEIGVSHAADLVKRLGLPNPMAPFLPSALGATEEPLLSMVSAYSVFPNGGVRVEPRMIRRIVDRDGQVIEETRAKEQRVMHEYVAAQMVSLMRGVVEFGTATRANALGREVAGKTGTVNNFTDAWFIGYTPSVVCGAWIGFSEKRSLGKGEAGSSAVLPFWVEFMQSYLKDKPKESFGAIPAPPPELKRMQVARLKDLATEEELNNASEGDILPATEGVPNLDPLSGMTRRPNTTTEKAALPAATEAPPTAPPPERVKPVPRPTPPPPMEKEKKGKKGKVDG